MPIFEYICEKCDHHFEAIVLGSQKPACPKCNGKKLAQQISSFGVAGNSASSGPGSCGTCGDPRGPGSCSMN